MGCASQRLRLHTRMPGCRQARRFMQVGVNSGSSRPHPPTHPPTHPHSHTHKHKTHTCSRWHAKVLHPPAFCIAHACLHTRAAESPSSRPRADGRHPSRLPPRPEPASGPAAGRVSSPGGNGADGSVGRARPRDRSRHPSRSMGASIGIRQSRDPVTCQPPQAPGGPCREAP